MNTSLFRNRSLLSLSLAHFTPDLYPSILPIMLPFLVASLHLSYAQAGLVATATLLTLYIAYLWQKELTDLFRWAGMTILRGYSYYFLNVLLILREGLGL